MRSTRRPCAGLVGVVKISHTVVNGASLVNFDGFAPASQWEELSAGLRVPPPAKLDRGREEEGVVMTYSYTQISQYLTCPRRYRHRYLDGGRRKNNEPPCCSAGPLSRPWPHCSVMRIQARFCSSSGAPTSSWTCFIRRVKPGTACCSKACNLLERFVQDGRVQIQPAQNPATDSVHSPARLRRQFCLLRRCHWRTGWHALRTGVEDLFGPISGGTCRHHRTRSAADLLLMDDRHR